MVGRTRENWIDATKGYGMILVILAHITEYSPIGILIYSFHMPLFFFVSGYLFSTKGSFREFAVNKAKRLVIPYFIYAALLLLWDVLFMKGMNYWQYAPVFEGIRLRSTDSYQGTYDWSSAPEQERVSVFLRDILGMIIQKRMWTIWFLACMILLSFLFYFLIRVIREEWLRAVAVMLLTLAGYAFYYFGGKPLAWNMDACLTASSFYYAGYLTRRYGFIGKLTARIKSVYILIVSVIINLLSCWLNAGVFGCGLDMYDCDYGMIPVMYVAAFSGILSVIMFGSFFSMRYVRWVGRHSMVFFIFHQQVCIPLYEGMLSKLGLLQGDGIIEMLRIFVILILTCTTLSLPVYLLEKNKWGA